MDALEVQLNKILAWDIPHAQIEHRQEAVKHIMQLPQIKEILTPKPDTTSENGAVDELLKRIESCFPENPYPESIFPMTEKEYVKEIPDSHKRTAISGFMGRYVFEATRRRFLNAIKDEFED